MASLFWHVLLFSIVSTCPHSSLVKQEKCWCVGVTYRITVDERPCRSNGLNLGSERRPEESSSLLLSEKGPIKYLFTMHLGTLTLFCRLGDALCWCCPGHQQSNCNLRDTLRKLLTLSSFQLRISNVRQLLLYTCELPARQLHLQMPLSYLHSFFCCPSSC